MTNKNKSKSNLPGRVGLPWSPLGEACGELPIGRGTLDTLVSG